MSGTTIFGLHESFGEAMVQVPDGEAYVMPMSHFRKAVDQSRSLAERVGQFEQALIIMIMQSTVCNSVHLVESRLARWLLMCHDRVGQDTFTITQEFLALMLGVRRPTVTETIAALEQRGDISYARRAITIVSRQGLEATSCECYRVIRAAYDRLLA